MESFRIEKKDIYTIEVNDNGDKIEFDLADIGLPFKCAKALEEIDKIKQNTKMREIVIKKQQDSKGKYMSKNEEETLKLWQQKIKKTKSQKQSNN
jgi:hypothetical protein